MKNIPYGYPDYKRLIENNCVYIDKTMYLEKLEKEADTIIYLRPRRFGKTLFTSMMYYYYDINSKNLYDELFKNTYVYNHPTNGKNSYYVLKFDFSGLDSSLDTKDMESSFNKIVKETITTFMEYYNINVDVDLNENASIMISEFLAKLHGKYPIYVMIDEYDNFTNTLLREDAKDFIAVLGKGGFVRTFFTMLKKHTGSAIIKTFITGICSISLDSMTSGFNIGTNITNDIEYNSMTGITHEELHKLIDYLDIKDDVFDIMEKNYDGYKFNKNTNEKVFNPNLVMYFLKNYLKSNQIPENLLDTNIYSDYNQIKNIVNLFNNDIHTKVINEILETGYVSGNIKEKFTLDINKFDSDFIVSLLYYFGYITIDSVDTTLRFATKFTIPNKVMHDVFIDYFINILSSDGIVISQDKQREIGFEMNGTGKIDKLNDYANELLKKCDNRIFINFNEKDIELIYFVILNQVPIKSEYMEYPLNGGYADLMVFSKYDVMIEFKYIKKSDYNENLLSRKLEEAKNQLITYSKDTRLDTNKLKRYAVIYVGKDLKKAIEV